MTDWFDPFGFRGMADRAFTAAARTLVGRRVEIDAPTPMAATISRVHEAAPSVGVNAAFNAQLGLWRRLDLVLERITVDGRGVGEVRVVAEDVRVIEALPQRIGARRVDLEVELSAAHVASWAETVAPGVEARIVDGQVIARHPRYARWGDVVLVPWVRGREMGVDAVAARMRGRDVGLPKRLQRSYSRELHWLPEGTELLTVELPAGGGVRVVATITDFDIPVDVTKLLTDLSTRGADLAVRMMTGRL